MELSASELDELRNKSRVARAVALAEGSPIPEATAEQAAPKRRPAKPPKQAPATQTPTEILCEWAWTKVELARVQKAVSENPTQENQDAVQPAIVAYRRAARKKKRLDFEYREHHEMLAALEQSTLHAAREQQTNQGAASRAGDAENQQPAGDGHNQGPQNEQTTADKVESESKLDSRAGSNPAHRTVPAGIEPLPPQ